jgi:hypothetical protein
MHKNMVYMGLDDFYVSLNPKPYKSSKFLQLDVSHDVLMIEGRFKKKWVTSFLIFKTTLSFQF